LTEKLFKGVFDMIPRYRAWLKNDKEMINVDEIHWFNGELDFIGDYITFVRKADEIELMQSTGLKDKNGKEIFEGDVISTYTDNLVIKRDNLLGFYVEVGEKRNYFAETVDIEYLDLFAKDFGVAVEIIGNIYENPELLEMENGL
jgi:hypothetical protein